MANTTCDQSLSKRAEKVVNQGSGVFGRIQHEAENAFDPVSNPEGKINLGIAENRLCEEMIWNKMKEISERPEPLSTLTYAKFHGTDGFRQSLQGFLTRHFNPIEPIDIENLFAIHGMTTAIESLALALCEAGDYMMVMSPYYYRAKTDVWERADVDIISVPTLFPDPSGDGFIFDLKEDLLEECYEKAKAQGKSITAINFVNPTNPTGDVYSVTQIQTLLNFAHRHQIHIIANEIYGLTTFDAETKFTSILSLPWPDPGRVHFCWGISKDLGLSGYHCAVLYTRNPRLQKYNRIVALYTKMDEIVQLRLKALLEDEDWVSNQWLPMMRKGLRERSEDVRKKLTPVGIRMHKASGSLFAWLDMRKFLPAATEEKELWLLEKFMAGGVLLMPGTATGAPSPGFFRMIISLDDLRHNEGIKRILSVVENLPVGPQ